MPLRSVCAALLCMIGGQSMCGQTILNAGFETGDLSNWTRVGFILSAGGPSTGGPQFQTYVTALAMANLDPETNIVSDTNGALTAQTDAFDTYGVTSTAISPVSGNYLAFVSNETSAGNDTLTGSSISQSFVVPSGVTNLTFSLALLNNDSTSSFADYNDFGGAALSQGTTILAQYNLDLDPASTADVHVTTGAHGGGFENSTPFITVSFDVSALVGQSVDLTFYALNYGGDNSVETRLLLDDIQFQNIPEPGTVGLLAVGLALAIGTWHWRRLHHRTQA